MYEHEDERLEKGSIIGRIFTDPDPMNPRVDWDNVGTMVCFSRNYNLGDEHQLNRDDFASLDELEKYLREERDAIVVLPLYLYVHSVMSISTRSFVGRAQHAHWDSGTVGFIYATKESVEKLCGPGKTNEEIQAILEAEVEVYDQYLLGEVYGFRVLKKVGCQLCGDVEEEDLHSCWGFFGLDDVRAAMKEQLDHEVLEAEKKGKDRLNLDPLLEHQAKEHFKADYAATQLTTTSIRQQFLDEVLGCVVAEHCGHTSRIIDVFLAALEDANFHTLRGQIEDLVKKEEGKE